MATTTIKMGKRGTIVLPAKLRKQFGLEDGSLLVTDDGTVIQGSKKIIAWARANPTASAAPATSAAAH